MRVVFDTNVIIDAVAAREPFNSAAEEILLMVAEEKIEGFLTANSVTDIFYVIRRSLSEDATRAVIRSLLYSLDIIEVGDADCREALDMQMADYEDALLATCALKIGADYIVSRDDAFLRAASPVRVISPTDFLKQYGN